MNPHLARVRIFPLKSFDGQDVSEAVVLRSGALAHDREYCLLDADGNFVNAKRFGERLLPIRSEVELGFGEITFDDGGGPRPFHLEQGRDEISEWLSERLGTLVRVARDAENGFPDDTAASGPTLISTASLETVASWFGLGVEEARRRFRANLEIGGVPAFWEDRLLGAPGETVRFRIGDVMLEGVKPCARCAVPSRDSRSGAVTGPGFAKLFADKRRETLPAWAEPRRFDHHYRLAVNTRLDASEAGKILETGDAVDLALE